MERRCTQTYRLAPARSLYVMQYTIPLNPDIVELVHISLILVSTVLLFRVVCPYRLSTRQPEDPAMYYTRRQSFCEVFCTCIMLFDVTSSTGLNLNVRFPEGTRLSCEVCAGSSASASVCLVSSDHDGKQPEKPCCTTCLCRPGECVRR